MKTLIEQFLKTAKAIPTLANYTEDNIRLTIPFSVNEMFEETDSTLTGFDYITNELVKLEKNKITGFTYWDNHQLDNFTRTTKIFKLKLDVFNNFVNELKGKYTHDKKFVIYSDYTLNHIENSLALLPFNLKNTADLKSSDNIEKHRISFRSILELSGKKAKDIISEEAKTWLDSQDTSSLDELNAIKEIIDEAVSSADLSIYNTPLELIQSAWPVLLAPNPFVINV